MSDHSAQKRDSSPRLMWIELVKGLALLWIFSNHAAELLFGYPHFGNPGKGWAPLADRIAQLEPISGDGVEVIVLNLLRYVGWNGDQGVQLFLVASGFGLTWGLCRRRAAARLDVLDFYRRRATRIYPLWWAAHVLFIVLGVAGAGLSISDPATYLSALGVRFTPDLFYYFSPAWWYVGLALQLYVVYPWIWRALRTHGAAKTLVVASLLGFAARVVALFLLDDAIDIAARGAFFLTRIPEFVFGAAVATWLHAGGEDAARALGSGRTLVLAGVVYLTGWLASFTWIGMIFAPAMLGAGAFVLLRAICDRAKGGVLARAIAWLGVHSYALYLVHDRVIVRVLKKGVAPQGRLLALVVELLIALAVTIVLAVILERAVRLVTRLLALSRRRAGPIGPALVVVGALAASVAALISVEFAVRTFDPQEVRGWGERPSLEPHDDFGWRLIPSRETRLRWESYDYVVRANRLGFPGPDHPEPAPDGTLRVMTIGDAFTSAEGVDTDAAWPRLLEARLVERGQPTQVANFAITGYGPNQIARTVTAFVPTFRPDVVLYGFYPNDFFDALPPNEEFRASIGFALPSPDGAAAWLRMLHFKRFVHLRLRMPLRERFRGARFDHHYFLGGFEQLETANLAKLERGYEKTVPRMVEIRDVTASIGARLILLVIPSPVQVCAPDALRYFPRGADLGDRETYDLEQPQRLVRRLAKTVGVQQVDLYEPLRAAKDGCPYQPRNLHFTADGHRIVADIAVDLVRAGTSTVSPR